MNFHPKSTSSHPITRCPDDILQLIMETVVLPNKDPRQALRQATCLAAINRAWRTIALDTPRIWSNITFSMTSHHHNVWKAYWNRSVERVKNVPVTIRISDLCSKRPRDLSRILGETTMVIKSLYLDFSHQADISSLSKIWGCFCIPVENLFISSRWTNSSEPHDPFFGSHQVDCQQLLESVRFQHALSLSAWNRLVFVLPNISNESLKELRLIGVSSVDLHQISRSFPRLEQLALTGCLVGISTEDKGMKGIRSLEVARNINADWLCKAYFPGLKCFSYAGFDAEKLDEFLASHQSITILSLTQNFISNMQSLANAACGITNLTIRHHSTRFLTSPDTFPQLRSLNVIGADILPHSAFDLLVENRCLLHQHPRSKLDAKACVVEKLYIEVPATYRQTTDLLNSKLFTTARKELEPVSIEGWIRLRVYFHILLRYCIWMKALSITGCPGTLDRKIKME